MAPPFNQLKEEKKLLAWLMDRLIRYVGENQKWMLSALLLYSGEAVKNSNKTLCARQNFPTGRASGGHILCAKEVV